MIPIINTEKLMELHSDENLVLVDARSGKNAKSDYEENHLDGAFHVDLNGQLSNIKVDAADGGRHPLPNIREFAVTLTNLGISSESHVVVYDDVNGANAASRFWWMLRSIGHKRVQVVNGGLQNAIKNGFPTNNKVAIPRKTKPYTADKWALPMATMEDVEAVSKMGKCALIDVRESYRFRGESEPIDPVAGHIPGAINIPLANNLDDNGLFRSPEDLKEYYQAMLQNKDAKQTIIHCGSGVTACHTILAMEYAGLEIPKLYVGSWSEWCRNEKEIAVEK